MTTTSDGVGTTELGGVDSAADAFLASFKIDTDAEEQSSDEETRKTQPESDHSEPEKPEAASDESPEETEEDKGEETEEKPSKKKYADSDDVFVKVKVGDQEHEASVKDLKRLFGQEAALTRRSQEVANERKTIETARTQYSGKLERMIKSVSAKADEYRRLDFISLAQNPNFSREQLAILQDEARKTFEEEAYLKGEQKELTETAQKEQQARLTTRAQECVKQITDQAGPYYIEGFNQAAFNELRAFAKNSGLDESTVNEIVDAPVIKLLHNAMLYAKGASKVTTKVVNKTPKKIVKTAGTPPAPSPKNVTKHKAAMKNLKAKGSLEAAADAFLTGWDNPDASE